MGEYNLEKHIKQSLENHPTALDKNLLWERIQVKQKKSALKSYSLMGILFLCLMTTAIYIFVQNTKDNTLSHHTPLNESLIPTKKSTSILTQENTTDNLSKSETQNLTQNTSNSTASNSSTTNNITKENGSDSQYNSNSIELKNSKSNNSSAKNLALSQQTQTNANDQILQNNSFNTNTSLSSIYPNTQNFKSGSDKLNYKNLANRSTIQKATSSETGFSNSNTPFNLKESKPSFIKKEMINDAGLIFNNNTLGLLSYEREIQKSLPEKEDCFLYNKKSIECYDPTRKRNALYVSAYGTVDYILKSNNTSIENLNYLAERDSTTHYQISNRAGIQLKYLLTNGFYIKSGIEQAIIRENFYRRTVTTTTEIKPDQLINVDVNSNGDTTKTYGNALVTTVAAKTWDVNNTHKSLDIPFLIGYQTKKGRIKYGLEAGVLMNLNYDFSGWLIGTNGQPTESVSTGNSYYSTTSGLNLTGGLNIIYALTARFNALAIASFRSNMDTVNANINPIKEKNMHIGIGFGIEYKLNKK